MKKVICNTDLHAFSGAAMLWFVVSGPRSVTVHLPVQLGLFQLSARRGQRAAESDLLFFMCKL